MSDEQDNSYTDEFIDAQFAAMTGRLAVNPAWAGGAAIRQARIIGEVGSGTTADRLRAEAHVMREEISALRRQVTELEADRDQLRQALEDLDEQLQQQIDQANRRHPNRRARNDRAEQ
jgi:hypothetical protein